MFLIFRFSYQIVSCLVRPLVSWPAGWVIASWNILWKSDVTHETLDEQPLILEPRTNFLSLAEPSQRLQIRIFIFFLTIMKPHVSFLSNRGNMLNIGLHCWSKDAWMKIVKSWSNRNSRQSCVELGAGRSEQTAPGEDMNRNQEEELCVASTTMPTHWLSG